MANPGFPFGGEPHAPQWLDQPQPLKVVPLVAPGPVDPTLIPALEALIEQVRTGEVAAVSYVAVHRDGSITSAMSPPGAHVFTMLGAIERLKLRFHALHVMEPGE